MPNFQPRQDKLSAAGKLIWLNLSIYSTFARNYAHIPSPKKISHKLWKLRESVISTPRAPTIFGYPRYASALAHYHFTRERNETFYHYSCVPTCRDIFIRPRGIAWSKWPRVSSGYARDCDRAVKLVFSVRPIFRKTAKWTWLTGRKFDFSRN